jgi:hypothetical protein
MPKYTFSRGTIQVAEGIYIPQQNRKKSFEPVVLIILDVSRTIDKSKNRSKKDEPELKPEEND